MRVLDLFSGIGGFSLGLERTGGFETVAFCEIEMYPRRVLKKHWPEVPIYDDVRELTKERLDADGVGPIDVITGGFPCQDISVAGMQRGIHAERSGLFSEIIRLTRDIRPNYVICENVAALLSGGSGRWFSHVLGAFSSIGYDCSWESISAQQVGAWHRRDRVWLLAYSDKPGHFTSIAGEDAGKDAGIISGSLFGRANSAGDVPCPNSLGERATVPDTISGGSQGQGEHEQPLYSEAQKHWETTDAKSGCSPDIWQAEPTVRRVADGLSDGLYEGRVTTNSKNRAARLKALGNSIVPQIAELIGQSILDNEA